MPEKNNYYLYISTLADWDPVKTVFVCPPSSACRTIEDARAFASETGWITAAEQGKCVLIVPLAPEGWEAHSPDLLKNIYMEIRNQVPAQQGRAIWGRKGLLWLWEVLLYAAGYQDGAAFAGQVLISHPNLLAAAALVDGAPTDFSAGELPSDHWLVPHVSADYHVKNCQIPVHTWIYTSGEDTSLNVGIQAAADYWNGVNGTDPSPAHQVRILPLGPGTDPARLTSEILHQCFDHVVRWKNGPDGTLALVDSREEFYRSHRYLRRTVSVMGNHYDYFVHLPEGLKKEEAKGLPLVITIHGRGEPAWMYTDKNGWESLADETGEFITVSPDSPGNIWFYDRDAQIFPLIVRQMAEEFSIDLTRVYLTGFSNGGILTREAGLLYPELFAAISPWNGPQVDSAYMRTVDESRTPDCIGGEMRQKADELAAKQIPLPAFIIYGDEDPGINVKSNLLMPVYMQANRCSAPPAPDHPAGYLPDETRTGDNYYTEARGYRFGSRFTTYVYYGGNTGNDPADRSGQKTLPEPAVCVTIMKNMPHGAIREESRAAWDFLKTRRRPCPKKYSAKTFP